MIETAKSYLDESHLYTPESIKALQDLVNYAEGVYDFDEAYEMTQLISDTIDALTPAETPTTQLTFTSKSYPISNYKSAPLDLTFIVRSESELNEILSDYDISLPSSSYGFYNDYFFRNNALIIHLGNIFTQNTSGVIKDVTLRGNTIALHKTLYKVRTYTSDSIYTIDFVEISNQYIEDAVNATCIVNPQDDMVRVYFVANSEWEDAYVYGFYGTEGQTATAQWPCEYPGVKMTYEGDNGDGQPVYSCLVPADIDFIKFSDGSSTNRRTLNIQNDRIVDGVYFVLRDVTNNKWQVSDYYT